jgi:hypothetical protein
MNIKRKTYDTQTWKKSDWGALVLRIKVENFGGFHPIRKYLRTIYLHLKNVGSISTL